MWIDIFILTEKQKKADYYSLKDCNVVQRYFFTIDNFAPCIDDDGLEYTSFYSGGTEWISWLSHKEFMKKYLNFKKDETKTQD